MASDSEDEGGFLDRDLADNSKNSSTSYPVASASRGQVSKSLSSLASQHLNDMRITIRHSDEDECCADSGVTNHMFKDYSTFVSYHKCHNKTAKLGNSTELPILGYGTAKFSLTGKIIVVCSPTCCTLFVNIGIWRDVVSSVIMTVTHSCSFQILQLKWMILMTVSYILRLLGTLQTHCLTTSNIGPRQMKTSPTTLPCPSSDNPFQTPRLGPHCPPPFLPTLPLRNQLTLT